MDNIKLFGPNLRSAIDKKGYKSYKKAAEAFGISLSYLNQLMRNEREPSMEMLETIADELGTTKSALLEEKQKGQQSAAIPEGNPHERALLIGGIFNDLSSLDESQLRRVNKFIADLLKSSAASGASSSDVG